MALGEVPLILSHNLEAIEPHLEILEAKLGAPDLHPFSNPPRISFVFPSLLFQFFSRLVIAHGERSFLLFHSFNFSRKQSVINLAINGKIRDLDEKLNHQVWENFGPIDALELGIGNPYEVSLWFVHLFPLICLVDHVFWNVFVVDYLVRMRWLLFIFFFDLNFWRSSSKDFLFKNFLLLQFFEILLCATFWRVENITFVIGPFFADEMLTFIKSSLFWLHFDTLIWLYCVEHNVSLLMDLVNQNINFSRCLLLGVPLFFLVLFLLFYQIDSHFLEIQILKMLVHLVDSIFYRFLVRSWFFELGDFSLQKQRKNCEIILDGLLKSCLARFNVFYLVLHFNENINLVLWLEILHF